MSAIVLYLHMTTVFTK